MDADDFILPLLKEIKIAHHIPGRIRLRFNSTILAVWPKLNGIEKKIQKETDRIEAIKDIRLNLNAGSVVVQYDTDILPPDFWQDVIVEKNVKRLKETAGNLMPGLQL